MIELTVSENVINAEVSHKRWSAPYLPELYHKAKELATQHDLGYDELQFSEWDGEDLVGIHSLSVIHDAFEDGEQPQDLSFF